MHIFEELTNPYGMFEWQKTQTLNAHQKQTIDRTKKVRLAKKYSWGLKEFVQIFRKLTTPCGMLEWRKTQMLMSHQKERIDGTKKVPQADKKVQLETRGFCAYFWEVDHPLWDV